MNDQVLRTIHSCFDQLLPYDPLNLKEYLLPWWDQEIFEEYGAKIPTGLIRNKDVLTDPEKAFKFFSERTECQISKEEHGATIEFEGGFILVGDGGHFSLEFPRLRIVGKVNEDLYTAVCDKGLTCFNEVEFGKLENTDIVFCNDAHKSENLSLDIKELAQKIQLSDKFLLPGNPRNEKGLIILYQHFRSRDRSLAIEEVKRSVLWRIMN